MHRRLLLAALAVACACAPAPARQEAPAQACKLTLEQSPALRGFRLGMSLEQLKARYPGVPVMEQQEKGHLTAGLARGGFQGADAGTFEGVNDIHLDFLDGRLASLTVHYNNLVKWRSVGEFASRVSELLKLPDAWRTEQDSGSRVMPCADFNIKVAPNRISLTVPGYQESLWRRLEQREEDRRRAFRP
jgi:hypothetical protein